MISQHWFRCWLGAVRHQAVTWISVDQNFWRHIVSLGHSAIIGSYIITRNTFHQSILCCQIVSCTLLLKHIHQRILIKALKCKATLKMYLSNVHWTLLLGCTLLHQSLFINMDEIGACISNCLHYCMWDVITQPCSNFSVGLIKPPLKWGHGWVFTSQSLIWT